MAFLKVWAWVGLGSGTKAERVEKMLGGTSGKVTQGTSNEKESGPVLDKPTCRRIICGVAQQVAGFWKQG